jgi:hypothetical protein
METSIQTVHFEQDYNAIVLKGISYDVRQNVHIILLIDISDSMNDGNKLDQVKKSMEFLLTVLQDNDYISLITFGDESNIIFQTLPMNSFHKEVVKEKIISLQTDGCTNLSAGLMNIQNIPLLPSTIKSGVLLLTDGHANVGVSNSQGLQNIVNHLLQNVNPSLSITTVGYGSSHKAELLQEIATVGSGSYNIVTNLEEIASIFGEVFGGLSTIVAQNVSVELPNQSQAFTGFNVENNKIKVGDIYSENETILFYKVADLSSPVKVIFDNMIDYTHHEQTIIPSVNSVNSPNPEKNIITAFYRFKVSSLLKKVVSEGISDEVKQEAQEIVDDLNNLECREDLIIQMLLDDCEKIVDTNGQNINHTQAVNYLQHSAYLSLGRGHRSIQEEEDVHSHSILQRVTNLSYESDGSDDSDDTNPVTVSAPRRNFSSVQSPFSNRMQSRHSEAMRTLSTQQPEE